MSNLSSYCVLIDAKIRASEKDLPVPAVSEFDVSFILKCSSDKDLPVQWKAHDALILCLDWSATNGKIVSGKVKKTFSTNEKHALSFVVFLKVRKFQKDSPKMKRLFSSNFCPTIKVIHPKYFKH